MCLLSEMLYQMPALHVNTKYICNKEACKILKSAGSYNGKIELHAFLSVWADTDTHKENANRRGKMHW